MSELYASKITFIEQNKSFFIFSTENRANFPHSQAICSPPSTAWKKIRPSPLIEIYRIKSMCKHTLRKRILCTKRSLAKRINFCLMIWSSHKILSFTISHVHVFCLWLLYYTMRWWLPVHPFPLPSSIVWITTFIVYVFHSTMKCHIFFLYKQDAIEMWFVCRYDSWCVCVCICVCVLFGFWCLNIMTKLYTIASKREVDFLSFRS